MLKNISVLTIMAVMLFAVEGIAREPAEATVSRVADFTLKDATGKAHSLSDFRESRAVVLIFVATRCPVSNAYNERMEELFSKYKQESVTFLGINSNRTEDVTEIADHARKNNLTFPILKDEDNRLADKLRATVTPEVFLLDPDGDVVYHGRIDDSRRRDRVTSNDLAEALDAFLAGEKPATRETKAFGCSIKRVEK